MPLADSSMDAIIALELITQLDEPAAFLSEASRVLKPGGRLVCFVPFMQGIHAAPEDFVRYTPAGLGELFREFEQERLIPLGPTSSASVVMQVSDGGGS